MVADCGDQYDHHYFGSSGPARLVRRCLISAAISPLRDGRSVAERLVVEATRLSPFDSSLTFRRRPLSAISGHWPLANHTTFNGGRLRPQEHQYFGDQHGEVYAMGFVERTGAQTNPAPAASSHQ